MTKGKSLYPRAFATPEGKLVSIAAMRAALSVCKRQPTREFKGWDWHPVPGRNVVAEFRRGLNERINWRGES